MNIKIVLTILTVVMIGSLVSAAALAWTIQDDQGNTVLIRCADKSSAVVAKSDGGWTVVSAGKLGKVGGQYDIVGQAALAGCGE